MRRAKDTGLKIYKLSGLTHLWTKGTYTNHAIPLVASSQRVGCLGLFPRKTALMMS